MHADRILFIVHIGILDGIQCYIQISYTRYKMHYKDSCTIHYACIQISCFNDVQKDWAVIKQNQFQSASKVHVNIAE